MNGEAEECSIDVPNRFVAFTRSHIQQYNHVQYWVGSARSPSPEGIWFSGLRLLYIFHESRPHLSRTWRASLPVAPNPAAGRVAAVIGRL